MPRSTSVFNPSGDADAAPAGSQGAGAEEPAVSPEPSNTNFDFLSQPTETVEEPAPAPQAQDDTGLTENGNTQEPAPESVGVFPEGSSGETVRLKSLGLRQVADRVLMYTSEEPEGEQRAFLVPKARIIWSANLVQEVDVSAEDVQELPSWKSLIDEVLPSREAMIAQMQQSFWLAGAFVEGDQNSPRIREQLFSAAYPYGLKEQ